MSESDTYLAIFLGSRNGPRMAAWLAQPEAERKAKEQEGMAAWKAWMEKHRADIAAMGGPLGKTKRVSGQGVEDVSNAMGAFTVVRAECTRRPQNCSRTIRTLKSFRARPSR